MGRSPAKRKQRRESWEQRKLQLTTWNQEARQQLLLLQQQQKQLAIEKDRMDVEKLKDYTVRQHKKVLAQLIELEKERTRQEKVPPSPRRSPRICPAPPSLVSPSFVMCAVAC